MTIMNMKVAMMMLIVLVGARASVGDLKYRFCQRLHTKLIHFMDFFSSFVNVVSSNRQAVTARWQLFWPMKASTLNRIYFGSGRGSVVDHNVVRLNSQAGGSVCSSVCPSVRLMDMVGEE